MQQIKTQQEWAELCWPASKLDQALEQIAVQTGLSTLSDLSSVATTSPPFDITTKWIEVTAKQLGLLAEEISTPYIEVEQTILRAGPALFRLTRPFPNQEPHYLLILKHRRQKIVAVQPDLTEVLLTVDQVRAAWCHAIEVEPLAKLDPIWQALGLTGKAKETAVTAAVHVDIDQTQVDGCWLFYAPPHTSLWQQIRQNRILWLLFVMLLMNLLQQASMLGGWAIIGQGSLSGRFDRAWLIAWVLIIFTGILFQAITYDVQGPLATSLLRFIKSRLLYGALQLESDEVRHQGSGQFFGRVLESDMVQNFLIGGALIALPFGVMLASAGVVLWFGAGGGIHVTLLVVWALVACYFGWRRLQYGSDGMRIYRGMTNDLVENMIGHRTRLAQESRGRWHEDEDKALAQYTDSSRSFDSSGVFLDVLIPRGWFIVGLAGIAYPFVTLSASAEKLALSIGGILLASMAFESLAMAMKFMAQSTISWQQVAPLLAAANRTTTESAMGELMPNQQDDSDEQRQPILMLRDVTFRYNERSQPILKNCHMTIMQGDQWLLEGPSGGGKSTLAALLSGLRQPQSGLLLLWGFDAHTVGDGTWRQRVVTAPQFQENHVFTDTLAFNLLMGRGWPPSKSDLAEAEQICRELGLGGLLDRMPDGLNQVIGDGGWQLSFGEQSRLFIGRALLQNADLVILDESFGALDPESLRQAMECVLKWTKTLLVIAHP